MRSSDGGIRHKSQISAWKSNWIGFSLEEYYWKQRAWREWLIGGDKNTKFFHTKASKRKLQNKINGVETHVGTWVTKKEDIIREIEDYFRGIFETSSPELNDVEEIIGGDQ